jgi:hypothetical protein
MDELRYKAQRGDLKIINYLENVETNGLFVFNELDKRLNIIHNKV